ncbi:MAG: hypothetical protein QOE71_1624 [Pseudonocardiales bacterium]|jgi:hypothetical protein|nr:hypothetical protein [Pseudonocardiales bacterium]MDQ1750568.1 hypothetical protein [Pseudonocardiales bacterium]
MNLQQTADILIWAGALALTEFTIFLVAVRIGDMSVIGRSRRKHVDHWAHAAPSIITAAVILVLLGAVLKWRFPS